MIQRIKIWAMNKELDSEEKGNKTRQAFYDAIGDLMMDIEYVVGHPVRDLQCIARNFRVFKDTLLHFRPWDWTYMLIPLRDAMEDMRDLHKNHSHITTGDEKAEELAYCIRILDHLIEDNYPYSEKGSDLRDMDKRRLLQKIDDKLFGWWD